jgi:hypothetical protein
MTVAQTKRLGSKAAFAVAVAAGLLGLTIARRRFRPTA